MTLSIDKYLNNLKSKQDEILKKIRMLENKKLEKNKKIYQKKGELLGKYLVKKYKDNEEELKELIAKIDPIVKNLKDREILGLRNKK